MSDNKADQAAVETSRLSAVPEEVLVYSGRVMSHFALMERALADLARTLLATPERVAHTVTSNLSFAALQDLVATLVDEHAPAHRSELRKLYRRIERAESQKNVVLQCLWGYRAGVDGGHRRAVVALDVNSLTSGKLHETAGDIADITRQLDRLRINIQHPAAQPPHAASA